MKTTREIKQIVNEHKQVNGSDVLESSMTREDMADMIAALSKKSKSQHEIKLRKEAKIHELNETLKAVKSICDAKIN